MGGSEHCVSCTTFNILAPIYKRLSEEDQSCRESQYRGYWLSRNERIIDRLLGDRSSVICLQEVWLGNEELVDMYKNQLGDAGYDTFKLPRTNNRGDGLLTAVQRDHFRVLNHLELQFNDFGDRVAQILHVESVVPFWGGQISSDQQILILNTHLLFPHDSSLSIIRLQQVYKILQYIETYQKEHDLKPIPIILCGDWNGSKRGHVYKFLRSQGFVSSYDTAHRYTDSDDDAHKWVSHRNHRGNICGVDFIWLLNPNKRRKDLKTSWNEAVFSIIKYNLLAASLKEDNAFAFLKGDSPGDYITYSSFCRAVLQVLIFSLDFDIIETITERFWVQKCIKLKKKDILEKEVYSANFLQLHLVGHPHGLTSEDIKNLWAQAVTDANGVMDYFEFQRRIWSPKYSEQLEEIPAAETGGAHITNDERQHQTFGFNVKDAVLFPPEVERGMWPENYSLSDHAPLTVVFSPIKIPCGQPVC